MAHLVKLCGRPPWPVEEGRMNEVIPGRGARFIHSFIHPSIHRSVGQPSWGGGELWGGGEDKESAKHPCFLPRGIFILGV